MYPQLVIVITKKALSPGNLKEVNSYIKAKIRTKMSVFLDENNENILY